MKTIYLDTETYSPIDLKKCGMHKYFSHSDAECIVLAYQEEYNNHVTVIDLLDTSPENILKIEFAKKLLSSDDVRIAAHNAEFDRLALGAYPLNLVFPIDKFVCTQSVALSHGYPGALSALCEALEIPTDRRKLGIGNKLIHIFCVPKTEPDGTILRTYPEDKPAEWAQFLEYAKYDIISMRECMRRINIVNYPKNQMEAKIYLYNGLSNSVGAEIDIEFCKAIRYEIDVLKQNAGSVLRPNPTQTARYLEYLNETYGLELPNLAKPTIEKLLNDDGIPEALIEDLETRVEIASSSVSKYDVLLRCADDFDNRIHRLIQYHGAIRTGRDVGRLFQPQNLPRPKMKYSDISKNIEYTKDGMLSIMEGEIMKFAVSAIRSAIVAPKGKKLVIADLSNIEGRVTTWLAGIPWKIQYFKDFDAGLADDIYISSYSETFGVPVEKVSDDQRQIGKVMELFLGYEGGVGAFLTGAKTYRINLDALAKIVLPQMSVVEYANIEHRTWEYAERTKKTYGLSKDTYIACEYIKSKWRAKHVRLTELWAQCNYTFRAVVENPGTSIPIERIYNDGNGSLLVFSSERRNGKTTVYIKLPSGRFLVYPDAKYSLSEGCSYMGLSTFTRKWSRLQIYGGKIVENVVQAASRDIFKLGQMKAWDSGYIVIIPVHDELVTETPDSKDFNADTLCDLMTQPIAWAKGLPLAAKGFESKRYRKG